ncbi:type-F conjugative transfer system secretin TraK [Azospirillum sp. A23]|uniref:type-F conjugative transfer system secretin TraK n=1 Tax=Azospirillum sp. A23 TaxID=3160608 RepID=UPI0036F2D647
MTPRAWAILAAVGLVALPVSAGAMQIKKVVDGGEISATVSKLDPNRIAVVGDRVTSVKMEKGAFSATVDKATGDLYVQTLPGGEGAPLNFFLTTERGYTYKLLLTPGDRPSEQIALHNPQVNGSKEAGDWERETPFQESVVRLIRSMVLEETIKGYEISAPDTSYDLGGGIRLVLKAQYLGKSLDGEAYTVRNTLSQPVELTEQRFKRAGVVAAMLTERVLQPGGETTAFVALRKGSGNVTGR